MAKATKVDVTPPVEPVFEVNLRLSEQEAEDLTVVLGLLPMAKTGTSITLDVFWALKAAGYDYFDIRNKARNTDEDRYQELHDWFKRAEK